MPFSQLARAEILLFGLLILHTVDHAVNQPARELPAGSGLVGIAGFVLVAVAILFALRGGRLAAPVGLLAGAGTVFGFAIVHLPGVGPLADPYMDFDANALSWILALLPIAVATWVAVIAARDLRGGAPAAAHW